MTFGHVRTPTAKTYPYAAYVGKARGTRPKRPNGGASVTASVTVTPVSRPHRRAW